MQDVKSLTIELVFGYLIVFCRIGGAFMVLPGIAESYVAIRSRLSLALCISLLILPNLIIPKYPENYLNLSIIIIIELITGIFIGSVTKFLISTVHILGMIIATISGLGSAMLFDPTQGTQGAIVGNFLSNLSIVLLFAGDMHHLLIHGFLESYSVFKLAEILNIGDMSYSMTNLIGKTFDIALKLAAPQIVIAIIIVIAGGILGRLMPAMQIFNLITPLQMIISFFILTITLSGTMIWYLNNIYDINKSYLIP